MDSRWRDHGDQYRAPAIIVDLIDRQNSRNAEIADRVRAGETTEGLRTDGPLQLLNKLLRSAALNAQIEIGANSELICTNHKGQSYPAAEMSDGEKSALLLLADVLVSDDGSIQLIDEPERHLHRSISAPLIVALTQVRPKDSFVIFTHDLDLAQELGATGSTYVVSECQWADKEPQAWALEVVPATGELPEHLRRAVLGGRVRSFFTKEYQAALISCSTKRSCQGRTSWPSVVAHLSCVPWGIAGLRGAALAGGHGRGR